MAKTVPAPWHLEGTGYIMSYKFPKQFILERGFLAKRFSNGFYGKVGYVILADYQSSPVGPYRELLFIPGKVRYQRRKAYTISKIFVSTAASAENGRNNWGIPKELAEFSMTPVGKDLETIKVTKDGAVILDITVKAGSRLTVPLHTAFKPVTLVQHLDGQTFWTRLHGKGTAKFAQNLDVSVNSQYFPNFVFSRHVAIMRVKHFNLTLAAAKVRQD